MGNELAAQEMKTTTQQDSCTAPAGRVSRAITMQACLSLMAASVMLIEQTETPWLRRIISSFLPDRFLKTCGSQYMPQSQAFRNFGIWRRPAARSALPLRRPPWRIPQFGPCFALYLAHRHPRAEKLPPPLCPST